MSRDPYHYPVIRYEKLNTDIEYRAGESKERRRKVRQCDRAFEAFERLRGKILSQAIAVEKELDRVITQYFVPDAQSEEDEARRRAFTDLVLGQESFSLHTKVEVVASLIGRDGLPEIPKPSKSAFRRCVAPVMAIRNQFAHKAVGVDWQSQAIALYYSNKQNWGFSTFKEDGKEGPFLPSIPPKLDDQYTAFCSCAIAMTRGIWKGVLDLQRTVEPRV